MNRRTVLRSILSIPGAAAITEGILAQEPARLPPPALNETPLTATVNADSLAETEIHTFNPKEFSALKRLGEIFEPSSPDVPGANEAKAAQFLDFLIGQSPSETVTLYRGGLDALNAQATQRYSKTFDALTEAEAAHILAPLKQPWSYASPAAILPRFLRVAKDDFRRATLTSREYITVVSLRHRNAGGSGQYWLPVD
jgi:Gluconate 2-dehydrogenase subunit 3